MDRIKLYLAEGEEDDLRKFEDEILELTGLPGFVWNWILTT